MLYLGFPGGGCWVAALVAVLRLAVAGARVDISGPRDRAVTGCRPPSVGFATSSPAVGIRRSHQQHRDDLHLCDGQDTFWEAGVLPISEINLLVEAVTVKRKQLTLHPGSRTVGA